MGMYVYFIDYKKNQPDTNLKHPTRERRYLMIAPNIHTAHGNAQLQTSEINLIYPARPLVNLLFARMCVTDILSYPEVL